MSMIKVIQANSQDFSAPVAALIKVSSRGIIGNDKAALVKRAGTEFVEKAQNIKFAKDEVPVHLIAIGATEDYGPNRNGDGFKRACCEKYHDTFVKHARFYRDHCFPAGTTVVMADRTRKPIETIKLGEKVATLEGDKEVTELMCNNYCGAGIKLKLSGVHHEITATAAHPVLILKREQLHCRHKYSRLGASAHGLKCKEFRSGLGNMRPQYVPIDEVRPGDYCLIPKPKCGTRLVEPEFARLLGWVASEGCLSANGVIQFTFSTKNTADLTSVTNCLKANGLHVTVTVRGDGLTQLASCSKALSAELSRYISGKLSEKRFTAEILALDRQSLLEVMSSYIEGDGHVGTKHHKGQLRIRSSSPAMLAALSDIIRALDVPASVQWDRPPGAMLSPTNGRVYAANGSGVVNVNSHFADTLAATTRKRYKHKSARRTEILTFNGCQLARVLAAEPVAIDEPVYNLEVAGPHHYIAGEVVVHNCNKNPAKSYGLVKASAYHEPMRRIELICALNATKEAADRNGGLVADKELEKLARGDDIGVSMACTIPFDVCSHCGNQAKTRAEYCDSIENGGHCKAGGLKHNMGKCAYDGSILYADNPNPRFFDISHVFRPADRIAYISGQLKAASAFVSGAELAEQLGVTAPTMLDTENQSRVVMQQLAALEKLAEAEQQINDTLWVKTALAAAANVCEPLALNEITDSRMSDVFRALADADVVLPPGDFLRLTVKTATADLLHLVVNALPDMFTKLAADPDIVSSLEQNAYNPSYAAGARLNTWAQKVAATKSILPKAVEKRAYLAVLRETPVVDQAAFQNMTKNAHSTNAAVNALARHYAMYKIAAFSEIMKKCADVGLTAQYCVMQNYVM